MQRLFVYFDIICLFVCIFAEICLFFLHNLSNFQCGMAYVFQDLSKLGRDLKHVLIVDNSPASYSFHPENAVSDDIFLASSYFMEHSAVL